jgi:signal transduction histidine kinase
MTARTPSRAAHRGRRARPGRRARKAAERRAQLPLSSRARLSLVNWPVRTRLIAVFAAASITGLVLGGLRVADAVDTANGYTRVTQLTVLGQQITLLAQDLQNERDLTAGAAAVSALQADAVHDRAGPSVTASLQQSFLAGQRQLAAAQRTTSTAATPVLQLAQQVSANSAFPASIQDAARKVAVQAGNLDAIRVEVLGEPPASVIYDYSTVLGSLFAFNSQLAGSSGDSLLSNEVGALSALSAAKDQAAQQRAILYATLIESGLNDAGGKRSNADRSGAPSNNVGGPAALSYAGGLDVLNFAQSFQQSDLQTFQALATPAETLSYYAATTNPGVNFAAAIATALATANNDPQGIFPQLTPLSPGFRPATAPSIWYTDQSAIVDGMQAVVMRLVTQIVARSQFLQHQAFETALVTLMATAIVVLLMLGVTALVGRSLVNPLRRLQADALEIATVRLPAQVAAAAAGGQAADGAVTVEPISVQSADEIGRVARAFDQVHAEAVRLAGNEAQLRNSLNSMFISLSRRSVPLIGRLVRMIDVMEQSEEDPDQLANLFAMDHLVTRMRRNSENLLVLAGEEPVRKWSEPIPLTDVARAATAEIENYSRVMLNVQPEIMVSGQAVADLVHLLAELIENATMFSPQNRPVHVNSMKLAEGGTIVEIRDEGIGLLQSRLDEMNQRLDQPPALDESFSRHMGLYAVSHLAARHRVRVRLRPNSPHGLSALVWLPHTLVRYEQVSPADVRGTGQQRSVPLSRNGGQPPAAGQAARPGRRTMLWFTAKHPSGRRPEDEPLISEASATAGRSAAELEATGQWTGYNAGQPASQAASPPGLPARAGLTAGGLPRRTPGSNAYPGSGTAEPGWAADTRGRTADTRGSAADTRGPAGGVRADGAGGLQLPSHRPSAEAVRSLLSGYQLGTRDALRPDPEPDPTWHADKENQS